MGSNRIGGVPVEVIKLDEVTDKNDLALLKKLDIDNSGTITRAELIQHAKALGLSGELQLDVVDLFTRNATLGGRVAATGEEVPANAQYWKHKSGSRAQADAQKQYNDWKSRAQTTSAGMMEAIARHANVDGTGVNIRDGVVTFSKPDPTKTTTKVEGDTKTSITVTAEFSVADLALFPQTAAWKDGQRIVSAMDKGSPKLTVEEGVTADEIKTRIAGGEELYLVGKTDNTIETPRVEYVKGDPLEGGQTYKSAHWQPQDAAVDRIENGMLQQYGKGKKLVDFKTHSGTDAEPMRKDAHVVEGQDLSFTALCKEMYFSGSPNVLSQVHKESPYPGIPNAELEAAAGNPQEMNRLIDLMWQMGTAPENFPGMMDYVEPQTRLHTATAGDDAGKTGFFGNVSLAVARDAFLILALSKRPQLNEKGFTVDSFGARDLNVSFFDGKNNSANWEGARNANITYSEVIKTEELEITHETIYDVAKYNPYGGLPPRVADCFDYSGSISIQEASNALSDLYTALTAAAKDGGIDGKGNVEVRVAWVNENGIVGTDTLVGTPESVVAQMTRHLSTVSRKLSLLVDRTKSLSDAEVITRVRTKAGSSPAYSFDSDQGEIGGKTMDSNVNLWLLKQRSEMSRDPQTGRVDLTRAAMIFSSDYTPTPGSASRLHDDVILIRPEKKYTL